jgi:uncharacterized protein
MKNFFKLVTFSLALWSGFVVHSEMAYGQQLKQPTPRAISSAAELLAQSRRKIEQMWWMAVKYNRPCIVECLLHGPGINPDIKGPDDNYTALSMAAMSGNVEMVKVLIAAGANPNIVDGMSSTALKWAVVLGVDIEIGRRLIAAGADFNIQYDCGETVLMKAVIRGNVKMVSLLIESGADLNIQDNAGQTALIKAVKGRNIEIVKMLIAALVTQYNDSINATIAENGWPDCPVKIIKCVIAPMINPFDVTDDAGRTALMHAAWCSHKDMLQLLLQAGASEEIVDRDGHDMRWYIGAGRGRIYG